MIEKHIRKLLNLIEEKSEDKTPKQLNESTGATDFNPKSQGGNRKELLAKYRKTNDPKDAEAARKAGATQQELKQSVKEGEAEAITGAIYPNAEVIRSRNGKPIGEIYQNENGWGCFHYRSERGYDTIDSRADALEGLKQIHQENGRSLPDYTIKGLGEDTQFSKEGVAEGGPFNYGAKTPRKGTEKYNMDQANKKYYNNRPVTEPKDQMVGNARLTKDNKGMEEGKIRQSSANPKSLIKEGIIKSNKRSTK